MLPPGFIAATAILPSTILMGASLPVIVRGSGVSLRGVFRWALLYGSNTAGAVFGCLLAGFYLLRVHNMATATYAAAFINLQRLHRFSSLTHALKDVLYRQSQP